MSTVFPDFSPTTPTSGSSARLPVLLVCPYSMGRADVLTCLLFLTGSNLLYLLSTSGKIYLSFLLSF